MRANETHLIQTMVHPSMGFGIWEILWEMPKSKYVSYGCLCIVHVCVQSVERVFFAIHTHTHVQTNELGFISQEIPNCQQGEKRKGRVVLLIDQEEEREHNRPFKS